MALTFSPDSEEAIRIERAARVSLNYFADEGRRYVASLALKKVTQNVVQNRHVSLWTAESGTHRLLSSFHQHVQRWRNQWNRHDRNWLEGNTFDQVRIAYSVPANISIVTLTDGGSMNMFPTDLHGKAGETLYLGSLRHNGLANKQVESIGQLALSRIESAWRKEAYALGKNHMAELGPASRFELSPRRSSHFDIPLPAPVLSYYELKTITSFDVGIHRIHYCSIDHFEKICDGNPLSHIHTYFAQWRKNHHLPTEYLKR